MTQLSVVRRCRFCGIEVPLEERDDIAPDVCLDCLVSRLDRLIKRSSKIAPPEMKRELMAIGMTEQAAEYYVGGAEFHG